MTIQCAFARRSSGMPLSGVAITSESTVAASSNRLTASFSFASSGAIARAAISIIRIRDLLVVRSNPARVSDHTVLSAFLTPTAHLLYRCALTRHGVKLAEKSCSGGMTAEGQLTRRGQSVIVQLGQ